MVTEQAREGFRTSRLAPAFVLNRISVRVLRFLRAPIVIIAAESFCFLRVRMLRVAGGMLFRLALCN